MIQLEDISKSFSSKTVLDNVSFQFPKQKRIALIGANGAGKTTLLNILCGLEEADGGRVILPGQFQIGYLPQEPNPSPKPNILAEAMSGATKLEMLRLEIESSLKQLESDHSENAIKAHESLEVQFQSLGGYALEAKTKSILAGLGFNDKQLSISPKDLGQINRHQFS